MKKRLHPWLGMKKLNPTNRWWQRWAAYAQWAPPVNPFRTRRGKRYDDDFKLRFLLEGIRTAVSGWDPRRHPDHYKPRRKIRFKNSITGKYKTFPTRSGR